MKNLLKILLILAFASPVFATSTTAQMIDTTVTTDQIQAMSPDAQDAWVASLLAAPNAADLYSQLNSDVQNWVISKTTTEQQKTLGINQ